MLVEHMDADVAALDMEIDRLTERKRLITNRQKQIKDYLRENMEATGISKIRCPLFTITCAKGRESVVVDSEDGIPDELMSAKTEVRPDKTAIAARLKAGEEKTFDMTFPAEYQAKDLAGVFPYSLTSPFFSTRT